MNTILDNSVEYLKGVGPAKGALLNKEIGVFTLMDLLEQYPYRYVDKTKFHKIAEIDEYSETVQIKGILRRLVVVGGGRKRRLTGRLRDESGAIDLVWFSGVQWLEKKLVIGMQYVVFGRVNAFNRQLSIPHPEMELFDPTKIREAIAFAPVYPSTEKLNSRGLDVKMRRKLMLNLFEKINPQDLPENLPAYILKKFPFPSHFQALKEIHFPENQESLKKAVNRLKFEELFFLQLRLLQLKNRRKGRIKGLVFDRIGDYFNDFFHKKLPFELTEAQKRVLKEIRRDLGSGVQMNRLLQGDVGSGKTIVSLMAMLMALDNGHQACLMAPTEILAQQHYSSITNYVEDLGIEVAFLSGSIKGKKRKKILEQLAAGDLHILIGTHALLEDNVVFKNLGLAITDEQHRFGVAQRAKLWQRDWGIRLIFWL